MPDLSEWLKTSQVLCGRRESRADGCCSFGTGQPLREAAWRSPRLFYCGSVGLHCQISFRGTALRFKYFTAYSPAPVSLQLKELPSRAPTCVRAPRGRCSWPALAAPGDPAGPAGRPGPSSRQITASALRPGMWKICVRPSSMGSLVPTTPRLS